MKYVLTFAPKKADYRVHALGCGAATAGKNLYVFPDRFESTEAAMQFAREDEIDKGGEGTVRAAVCKCTR